MRHRRFVSMLLVAIASVMAASCGGKARSEFVAGCTSQGAPKSICKCVYSKLQDKYGLGAMEEMQERGVTPPDFAEAIVSSAAQCGARGGQDASSRYSDSGRAPGLESSASATDILGEPVIWHEGVAYPASQMPSDTGVEQEGEKSPASVTSINQMLDSTITTRAKNDGGSEYVEARRVVKGDVNGDGLPDTAVMFTIEVTADNTYMQYLTVLMLQTDGSSRLTDTIAVGSAGQQASDLRIQDGAIKVKSLTQGPDDPDCCPTFESEVEYLLHNGKLKRIG
jgi:hypothetical protein